MPDTTTLPAPTRPHESCTTISIVEDCFANAATIRPGDTFTIAAVHEGQWFRLMFWAKPNDPKGAQLSVSIHRDGIPSMISELLRLYTETSDS